MQTYNKYGCRFEGKLAVVDYEARRQEISDDQPLGGFGQMSSFDALDEAKELMSKHHPEYKILLAIPELVVRLPQQ